MTADEYRQLRLKAGLTQAELAKRLGVHIRSIKARENGIFRITREAEIAVRAVLSGHSEKMDSLD